jgi:hypothetical protein
MENLSEQKQPEENGTENSPDLHIVRRLGQKIFELDNGDFAVVVDTRKPVDKTKTLAEANQELFDSEASTSMADYEALGVINREALIEARPFIPEE